jgi:hypothetical protein
MPTLRGKLLIGWMSKDEAVKLLMEECVFDPPLTAAQAEEKWQTYKERVDRLHPRAIEAPITQGLTLAEKLSAKRVLNKRKRGGGHILRVVKIDPRNLTVHQLSVVTEISERYIPKIDNPKQRSNTFLGLGFPPGSWRSQQVGQELHIDLSHGEFNLGFDPKLQQFAVQENARWVTVHGYGARMLLWAGYHRAYALLSSQTYPEDTERVLLAVETTEADRLLGANSELPFRRDTLISDRPPLLRDFLDADLAMDVNLRKGRWRFHVHLPTMRPNRLWIHDAY